MSERPPLVSICVPNLNKRPFLPERMETLLGQTLTDWELIVCDSYSEDGSWEFFQKFKSDPRVRLYQVPREGIYAGWNECVRRARGQYVYIATSDDTAEPALLEKLVELLSRYPEALWASCNVRLIDQEGKPVLVSAMGRDTYHEVYGHWLQHNHRRHRLSEFVAICTIGVIPITASLMRRQLFATPALMFPAGRPAHADFEWGLRAALSSDRLHLAETLATQRECDDQATQQVDWAVGGWMHSEMVRETCRRFADQFPIRMRTRHAADQLAHPMELRAFNALQLYPKSLFHSPRRTFRNLAYGFHRQPKLTVKHLLRGARWKTRPLINLRSHIELLLQEFGLPPLCTPLDADAERRPEPHSQGYSVQ